MITLADMNIFVAVVKANSFRRGAESLGMPASTVSRRIGQLEQRIGLRLLNRTTRTLSLTDAGRVYFGRCKRLVEEAEMAHEELQSELTEATGTLKMSLPADFAQRFMAPLIADFSKLHPQVNFQLDLSPQQVNLAQDPFDLAVRIGQLKDSGMISRRVTELTRSYYAAPELAMMWQQGENGLPKLDMGGSGLESSSVQPSDRLRPCIVANSIGMLIRLCTQGCGIALLPDLLVQDEVHTGALVTVAVSDQTPPSLPVFVLTETRLLPAKTRLFIEFMVSALAPDRG